MTPKIRNIYAGGNTARGFHSFFDSVLQGLDRLFILKGGPGTGKSSLMKAVGETFYKRGFDIEYIHCASDNGSIDGVLIPFLNVGIVDGTAPHVIEPKVPGAVEEYVNLGAAWDSEQLIPQKAAITRITDRISECYRNAYATFSEALAIHDEWEKFYITNMDFAEANKVTEELIQRFFGNQRQFKEPKVRHMFFGAATPAGAVDHIQNLTGDLQKRFFIKGRPGSGKSTMLKSLAAAAEQRGFDVEVYHCGFDPNSLDMVLLPELSLCIFDSTAPHEYFPSKDKDEIVDMYARTITPGTDEKYATELLEIQGRYSSKMKAATAFLQEAKSLHDELEAIYIAAMDFTKVDAITADLISQIARLAQVKETSEY
ncbi:MAG TPA: PRK06851 family protein [Bacilli bacterium]|nr:PRK06851 family protein [Bacilli bacterium]